jgi:hypothetical protein
MRSEKQKASTSKYKNRWVDPTVLTFEQRVARKEMWEDMCGGQVDPDVASASNFLRLQNQRKRTARNKAVAAIMQMRGI